MRSGVQSAGYTEVEWETGARLIHECEYLLLRSIREPEELTLELTITEAKPQTPIIFRRTKAKSRNCLLEEGRSNQTQPAGFSNSRSIESR
jgi:hypothetical protein